jgi:hypothetical protein
MEALERFQSGCIRNYLEAYIDRDPDLVSIVRAFEDRFGTK